MEDRRVLAALTVTSAADDGPGTLREAVMFANSTPGHDVIDFDLGLLGTDIQLSTGELSVTDSVTIDASNHPTAMIIDATLSDPTPLVNDGAGSRILNIDDIDAATNINVELRNLTLTGGDVSGKGGAIQSRESVTLDSVQIRDNFALGGGGGLSAIVLDHAALVVQSSSISGNSTSGDGGGLDVYAANYGAISINSSYLGTNLAGVNGGAMAVGVSGSAMLTASGSFFSNNVAGATGGGLHLRALSSGTVELSESFISGNVASTGGGGIYSYSSDYGIVSGTGLIINLNQSGVFGGGWHERSNANGGTQIFDSLIAGNLAGGTGGGLSSVSLSSGWIDISESDFVNNEAIGNGGGINAQSALVGSFTLRDSTVSGNKSQSDGGGLNLLSLDGSMSILRTNITDNSATRGGGMFSFLDGGTGDLQDSTLSGNDAMVAGGGAYVYQINHSEATIDGTQFSDNTLLDGVGGGLRIRADLGGTTTVSDSQFTDNFALVGGGVYAGTFRGGSVTVSTSTIDGNTATHGGGISLKPRGGTTVSVFDSTISNNRGISSAGGVFAIPFEGLAQIRNSTITGNSARNNGGGVVASAGTASSLVSIEHSTIAFNEAGTGESSAGQGGGVYGVGNVRLDHTIVADNVAFGVAVDLNGSFDVDFSLVENIGAATLTGSDNVIGVSPVLLPLADNGGLTLTHGLAASSPAINAGDSAIVGEPDFDQRGTPFDRIQFDRIDIGAFEFTEGPTGDFDADGDFDCDDIDSLVALVASNVYLSTFDMNLDGELSLDDVGDWLAAAGAANLPSGNAYLFGDANLDGAVNGEDFLAWNSHKFTATATWCKADFNADGVTDGADFIIWNSNKFTSSAIQAQRPESFESTQTVDAPVGESLPNPEAKRLVTIDHYHRSTSEDAGIWPRPRTLRWGAQEPAIGIGGVSNNNGLSHDQ